MVRSRTAGGRSVARSVWVPTARLRMGAGIQVGERAASLMPHLKPEGFRVLGFTLKSET